MSITVETLTDDDDLRDALTPVTHSFGYPVDDDWLADAGDFLERDRFFAAREDGRTVGSAASLTRSMAVPGGTVRTAAVTEVGVFTTHRRRGIASMAMKALQDDAVRRGDPVATLYASEATIYRRFGFGPASATMRATIDARHGDLVRSPDTGGTLRIETVAAARADLETVFERAWPRHPGEHSRSTGHWTLVERDRENDRDGWSALQCVVHVAADGAPDGYLLLRTKDDWSGGIPNGQTAVTEVVATSDEVELALLAHVLERDLFPRVELRHRPLADPFRWVLRDNRRLVHQSDHDSIWVRLLDVPAALAARRYDASGSIVVEVTDDFRPEVGGRFLLHTTSTGVGTCRRTDDAPDLTLPTYDLASAYLGQHRLRTIAHAGRVVEHRDGAIADLDRMLHWPVAARNYTGF